MDDSGQNKSGLRLTNSALALKNKITPSLTNKVMSRDPNFFSLSLGSMRNTFDSKEEGSSITNPQESISSFRRMSDAKTHILSIDQKLDSYLKEIGNEKQLAANEKNSPKGMNYKSLEKIPLSPEAVRVLESLEKLRRSNNQPTSQSSIATQYQRGVSADKSERSHNRNDLILSTYNPNESTPALTKLIDIKKTSGEKSVGRKQFSSSPVILADPFSKREHNKTNETVKDFSLHTFKGLTDGLNKSEEEFPANNVGNILSNQIKEEPKPKITNDKFIRADDFSNNYHQILDEKAHSSKENEGTPVKNQMTFRLETEISNAPSTEYGSKAALNASSKEKNNDKALADNSNSKNRNFVKERENNDINDIKIKNQDVFLSMEEKTVNPKAESKSREIEKQEKAPDTPKKKNKVNVNEAPKVEVQEEKMGSKYQNLSGNRIENMSSAIKRQKILEEIEKIDREIEAYEENDDNGEKNFIKDTVQAKENPSESSKKGGNASRMLMNEKELKGQERFQYLYEKGVRKEKERQVISKLVDEMREEEQLKMCSFHPEIGNSKFSSVAKDDVDVRTKQWLDRKEAKIREKQLLKLNEELESCTFHPEVTKYTAQNIIRVPYPKEDRQRAEISASKIKNTPKSHKQSGKTKSGKSKIKNKVDSNAVSQFQSSQKKSQNSSEKNSLSKILLDKHNSSANFHRPLAVAGGYQAGANEELNGEIQEIMKIFTNVNNILAHEPSLRESNIVFRSDNSQFEFLSDQKTLKKKRDPAQSSAYQSAQKELKFDESDASDKKKKNYRTWVKENIPMNKLKSDKKDKYNEMLARSSLMTGMMNEIVMADTIK